MSNFQVSWVSPPGETILDILCERKIPKQCFAEKIGLDIHCTESLLSGDFEITDGLAYQLSEFLGADADFWMNRERQYRDDVSRVYRDLTVDEDDWLKEMPVSSMQQYGWIPSSKSGSKNLLSCLDFFGVPDIAGWVQQSSSVFGMAKFRTSATFAQSVGSASVWLRQGEILAENISCAAWDKERFVSSLVEIRALTNEESPSVFIPKLKEICAGCGVAVVVAKTPDGCRASGATRFLSPHKALLLLSFRYLSDDHFWFTFFHEAAHLILHGEDSIFMEGEEFDHGRQEEEANEYSSSILVPDEYKDELYRLDLSYKSILKFSRKIGVSPGIVLGQLQYFDLAKKNHFNKLKVRYSWAELGF
ncbi:ImmA/IrrE family metallo-endopeptidase [Pseudomonas nicosulfuronedens]|uniref:ImmA/IrrE family metallo-endopeptidase n=1 Tax=Pseudomonas nicosulfuronedens TaxID=2571105 RepID=UPI002447F7AC|nr:ImmA/IrrE family metallo-endopeptidase [Pseudomonas nicosulfuronedens]MDH1009611.1 ImmA/IrrE family metallo-endopeptidase [Pseudomonas nicosulfuronedens]MDH1980910.1 ImmA/IrrE family metallo-endopeptidase [Pseudomonas nicosulfuronedens]MDH2030627.1 ImmA/IrrE family metallo-endopeptidase [Pseudomonas nicosulfuronedens]